MSTQQQDIKRTMAFARELANPDFSLSVPHVAKQNILHLVAEIERQEKLLLDIDSMLSENYVTLYGTSSRMLEEGLLPKAERPEDYDQEVTMRYAAYAAQARTDMVLVRDKIGGKK